ncbi:SDR family NAD(P)-dependent oxidoreductase [Mycobacterium sp. E1747]|uniref:SDR family NAD(P)-dependent oxidoreductase n=1 Tax=Mycobacterium sp. E1747 TaxID=1834128 RepID=UPI0007FCE1B7|nr:SDR family oxidoreductase [Mycobacterium sp. E1747]OBH13582.1 3-oxoacyl-ACP reductase [Mycobacterium sp. E1747]
MPQLKKVAVITGASSGIGAALVETYCAMGYSVTANSRNIGASARPDLLTVSGDVADPSTAERIVNETVARFGRIDTLVNNAGVFLAKSFTEYTLEDFGRVMGTNVAGFFHLCQRVIAQMLFQGPGGHVINVTTTLVERPDARIPAALTALSKGGLDAVTKALAIEYARSGVRANAISPGVIDTPMHGGLDVTGVFAHMHPQGRVGTIADIVRGVQYLETAPFVTGEVLHIDGGQSAGR